MSHIKVILAGKVNKIEKKEIKKTAEKEVKEVGSVKKGIKKNGTKS
jgi:hypothetical protein